MKCPKCGGEMTTCKTCPDKPPPYDRDDPDASICSKKIFCTGEYCAECGYSEGETIAERVICGHEEKVKP